MDASESWLKSRAFYARKVHKARIRRALWLTIILLCFVVIAILALAVAQ